MRILEITKVYKHYKTNDLYIILAINEADSFVYYRNVTITDAIAFHTLDRNIYDRPYEEFNEYFSDKKQYRFEEVIR